MWEAKTAHAGTKSLQIQNYRSLASRKAARAATQIDPEQFKQASLIGNQHGGGTQLPRQYLPDVTVVDNDFGEEIHGGNYNGPIGSKNVRKYIDQDTVRGGKVSVTARNSR